MNVSLVASNDISFLRESLSHSLSSQQKKIFVIVSTVFAFFATCYLISRFWLHRSNILNGQGVKIVDGRIQQGNFINGKLFGEGKITYPDGRIEEGVHHNDKLDVLRKITYPNGKVWEGKFDDKLNGEGKFIDLDNVKKGSFKNGLLHGNGEITYSKGIKIRGSFHLGEPVSGEKSENGFLLGFYKYGEFCEKELPPEDKAKYAIVPPKMSYVNAFRAIYERAEIPPACMRFPEQIKFEEEQVSTSQKVAEFFKNTIEDRYLRDCYIDYAAGRRMKVSFKNFPRLYVDYHNSIYGIGAAQKALDEYDKIPSELRFDKNDSYKFSDLRNGWG